MRFRLWFLAVRRPLPKIIPVLAVALALLASVLAAQAYAGSQSRTTTIPAPLVGTWTRSVSKRDYRRFGDDSPGKTGVWAITITRTGALRLYDPGTAPSDKPDHRGSVKVTGRRITVNVGCPTTNSYRWTASARYLTFTYVRDPGCRDRAAVFAGRWKRS